MFEGRPVRFLVIKDLKIFYLLVLLLEKYSAKSDPIIIYNLSYLRQFTSENQ